MSIFDKASIPVNNQASVTLVGGTGTISDANVTTNSKAVAQLVTPGGTLGVGYKVVCTAGTVTVTSVIAAGTINATDTSTLIVSITY